NDTEIHTCTCLVRDIRVVTNSGGSREQRVVIETLLNMGDLSWPFETTLTNRDEMGFRMLLGRTAMKGRFLVDPGKSFCLKN
ncbi:MAG: RimK/LysX family protein, partial [Nitrospirota bacterium]|nr:RimK/LysX family protein [Nitrospirota bacterium]